MKVFKLIYVLYKIKLLSPVGLYRLVVSFLKNGTNLMTLLQFAEMKYSNRVALVDDHESISYKQLLEQSIKLSISLKEYVQLKSNQKVAFFCNNHVSLVKSIFAVSRLGSDIYLLNAEISKNQFNELVDRHDFDLLIYDVELSSIVEESNYMKTSILSYHESLPAINNFLKVSIKSNQLPRTSTSRIILQTSGITGVSKEAIHESSLFNFLNPFVAFIRRLKILNYSTAYIGTPIYHGYGIAVLLLYIPLGKKIIISSRFNAKKACNLVRKHQVEVITVVPIMLKRMLAYNAEVLKSLSCIASGGEKLSTKLVDETYNKLGNVLYNLYGTSEAGLNFIAIPKDLTYSPTTIGKKINGVRLKILDEDMKEVEDGEVGQFWINNDWSMKIRANSWIRTGDLGYKDHNEYYFLSGRIDDMVISGGENVYPVTVEEVLLKHLLVEDVAVIGINDEQFGQRLKAFVLPVKNARLTEEELLEWLRSRVARFQLPKEIDIVHYMPYTPLGKIDKKRLKNALS